jgi:phage FluMu protein Com
MAVLESGVRQYRKPSNPTGWEEVRCFNCRRMLMRKEPGALGPDKRIEVKCPKCSVMNYLIGSSTT